LIDRTLQRSTDALVGREFDPLLTPHLAYLAARKKFHATKRLRVMLISSSVDEIPPLGIRDRTFMRKLTALVLALLCFSTLLSAQNLKTKNVVLIVADGLRWQEIFTGADATLLNSEHGGIWAGADELRKEYWANTPAERRKRLFPFLWETVATQGTLYGNQTKGSVAHVTNGQAFSYPGYNEMLTGTPDPRIDKNEFGPNPNVTVFEWLNQSPELRGQVSVFATWAVFNDIFNQSRSGVFTQVGWSLPKSISNSQPDLIRRMYTTLTRFDEEDIYNALLQVSLLDYLQKQRPRLLFVGYGETDNWAHQGRYDLVLASAHQFDGFVAELWNTMQAIPEYKDTTTFIITTDHGRGSGTDSWKEHGVDQKGSENIWIAILGPDTAARGEHTQAKPVTQAQIAATVAALLGKDFSTFNRRAAPPLPDVLDKANPTLPTQ